MRIFLAGATGVVGRRLATLLSDAGHEVTGTTRISARLPMLRALGIAPIVVDVFDAGALKEAVAAARPDVVIHQLTDLPSAPGTPGYPAAQEANRRLRIEGTRATVDRFVKPVPTTPRLPEHLAAVGRVRSDELLD